MSALDLVWREMREDERNYVLSSWLRSYAGKGQDPRDYAEHARFYDDYAPVVRNLVTRSRIAVATLRDEPALMLGWVAIEGDALHYVVTKPRWRRMGVAKWMLSDFASMPVVFTHRTTDALRCPIPSGWTYRRWRVWPAEEKAA